MFSIKKLLGTFLLPAIIAGCTKDAKNAAPSDSSGKGGSLARFTIAANHLYLADNFSIEAYDLTNPRDPLKKSSVRVDFFVETIYPFQDKLFVGSRDGMFIYSIADPAHPVKLGEARHVRSCDPVVANDTIAYVTLMGNQNCGPAQDGLYIYNIKNITSPSQVSLLPVSTPLGLGLKDSVVYVCRGSAGLSLVNVNDPSSPKLMYTVNDASFIDVIPLDDLLVCYVGTGLRIYDISDPAKIVKIGGTDY